MPTFESDGAIFTAIGVAALAAALLPRILRRAPVSLRSCCSCRGSSPTA